MNQHEFDILLQKYLAGQCTEAEAKYILSWYENQNKVESILTEFEKEEIEKRVWSKIKKRSFPSLFTIKNSSIAASILIVILSGLFFISERSETSFLSSSDENLKGIEMKNTSSKAQKITLEDGSVVELSPNSFLSYPEHFDTKIREVFLKGEAFFTIKKDISKPFIVRANDITTKVLGTSFRIKAYEGNKTIEVQVKTGRVSVYEDSNKNEKSKNGVILTPNQQIVFVKDTKVLVPSIVDTPEAIIELEPSNLIFSDTPIKEIIDQLKVIYGLEIIIENPSLNNCIFTGDLNDLSLSVQLDILCKSINAQYEERGTSVFIHGEGCQ